MPRNQWFTRWLVRLLERTARRLRRRLPKQFYPEDGPYRNMSIELSGRAVAALERQARLDGSNISTTISVAGVFYDQCMQMVGTGRVKQSIVTLPNGHRFSVSITRQ